MPTSPFLSGRIPQDLYDKVEEHCKETGKGKTDLLIEALSTYLNFPVRTQTTNFVPQPVEVTKEMFESLRQQVNKLELLITQNQSDVINQHDNRSNGTITLPDNTVVMTDNSYDSSTATNVDNTNHSADNSSDNTQIQLEEHDNKDDKLESKITDNDITPSDNSSDNVDSTVATVDDDSNDKSESETVDNTPSASDNSDDNADNQDITAQEHPVFQSITSTIVAEKTGLKIPQINSFRGKVTKKFNKEQKVLTPKTLLEQPEEIKTNIAITVDNASYQLFYLGEDTKGQSLWSLVPSDNSRYQPITIEFDYTNIKPDK